MIWVVWGVDVVVVGLVGNGDVLFCKVVVNMELV